MDLFKVEQNMSTTTWIILYYAGDVKPIVLTEVLGSKALLNAYCEVGILLLKESSPIYMITLCTYQERVILRG